MIPLRLDYDGPWSYDKILKFVEDAFFSRHTYVAIDGPSGVYPESRQRRVIAQGTFASILHRLGASEREMWGTEITYPVHLRMSYDGPGSYVSILEYVEDVLKENTYVASRMPSAYGRPESEQRRILARSMVAYILRNLGAQAQEIYGRSNDEMEVVFPHDESDMASP